MSANYPAGASSGQYEHFAAHVPPEPKMCKYHPERRVHPESEYDLCATCELEGAQQALAHMEELLAKAEADYERGQGGRPYGIKWCADPEHYACPFSLLCDLRNDSVQDRAEVARWKCEAAGE